MIFLVQNVLISPKCILLSHALTNIFNDCVKSGDFSDILKYADINPVFKEGDTSDKRTFSNSSKVFEKLIFTQINCFMEPKLSKYLARFRKSHNTRHAFPSKND